jgi:hypothetical protein
MLPRLEAERELASINAMSAAYGGMRRGDRQRYLSRLSRVAQGGGAPMRATPGILAAMGVAVIVVPPEGEGTEPLPQAQGAVNG